MDTLLLVALLIAGASAFIIWFGRWVGKTMAYAFCNTMLSAREPSLLPTQLLVELAGAPDLQAVRSRLEEKGYRIEAAPDGGVDWLRAEREMHERICREFSEILQVVPKRARPIVEKLLRYREMVNLKVVVVGLHEGLPKEEIVGRLLPCPMDSTQRFELLASAPSVEGLLEFLKGSEYHAALAEAMEDYRKYGISVLVSAIEKHYWADLWRTALLSREERKSMREIFGFWIDSINLTTALRMREAGVPPAEAERYLILPGYELTLEMVRAVLLAEDIGSAAHAIRTTAVGDALLRRREGLKSAADAERILREELLRRCRRSAMRDFFSPCPIVYYILRREAELENVRTLLRMKAAGYPREDVMRMLLVGVEA